jgi:hypothetical protein
MWLGGAVVVAGAIAGLVMAFPGPKPSAASKLTNIKAEIVRNPKHHAFAPEAKVVIGVITTFIRYDVTEKHLNAGWDVVGPALRRGYTKRSWVHGNTLPFPAYPAYMPRSHWMLSFSYPGEVGLRLDLFPPPHMKIRPLEYNILVRKYGHGKQSRWLVNDFTPAPQNGVSSGGGSAAGSGVNTKAPMTRSGRGWLLIPIGIFGGLIIGLGLFFGIRSWRNAAYYRDYFRDRQTSS